MTLRDRETFGVGRSIAIAAEQMCYFLGLYCGFSRSQAHRPLAIQNDSGLPQGRTSRFAVG
jgi:hypothetical protein